jgi:hypothetical protein
MVHETYSFRKNCHSSHPTHQKTNIVKNMLYRASELSSPEYLDEGLQKIRTILKNNNYPRYFCNKIINEFFHPITTRNTSSIAQEMTSRCTFPNIPVLANRIKKLMQTDGQCQLITYNLKTTNCLFSKLQDQANRSQHTQRKNEQKNYSFKSNLKKILKT